MASENGSKMYLLPFDGRPRLLENTAFTKEKLFNEINKAFKEFNKEVSGLSVVIELRELCGRDKFNFPVESSIVL